MDLILLPLLLLFLLLTPVAIVWLIVSHLRLMREFSAFRERVERQLEQRGAGLATAVIGKTTSTAAIGTDGNVAPAATMPTKPATTAPVAPAPSEPAAASVETHQGVIRLPEGLTRLFDGSTKSSDGTTESSAHSIETTPPFAYVFDVANLVRLGNWLRDNWFIVVAAVSLALAGVFLVQYGIEKGLLSPRVRVAVAVAFGFTLIGIGDWARRKLAGVDEDAVGFLPSGFASAGIVTLFATALAARHLYGMLGAESVFIALLVIATLALVLGWLFGTFLGAIGILGAVAAPFIVGGESSSTDWLFHYFALVAIVGLGVDAARHSAWLSSLAVGATSLASGLVFLDGRSTYLLGFAALVALGCTFIPSLQLRPGFPGAMCFGRITGLGERGSPRFETRLATAGIAVLAVASVAVSFDGTGFWLALIALSVAVLVIALWLQQGSTLDDLAAALAVVLLLIVGLHGAGTHPASEMLSAGIAGISLPRSITLLVCLGVAISALAFWRYCRGTRFPTQWAIGSALSAPVMSLLIALLWSPLEFLDRDVWAMHVALVAVAMSAFAERAYRGSRDDRLVAAIHALAGYNMIGYGLTVMLTDTALTLALAALAASAAWVDRRFDLRLATWFIQVAVAVCVYRLVVQPGVLWALDAALAEVTLAYLGTAAMLAATWWLLDHRQRTAGRGATESAVVALVGIYACVLLYRFLDNGQVFAHWSLSLFGMIWLIMAAVHLRRYLDADALRWLHGMLAGLFLCIALTLIGASTMIFNPLQFHDRVLGPPVFNSLLVAYLLPAIGFAAFGKVCGTDNVNCRRAAFGIALALTAFYIGLAIRHLWHGSFIDGSNILDGELYTYTIALLIAGASTLVLGFVRGSDMLRRIGLGILAVAIAKVYFIDTRGLQGLARVLSFLALGLVLAALALVNRWMSRRGPGSSDDDDDSRPCDTATWAGAD